MDLLTFEIIEAERQADDEFAELVIPEPSIVEAGNSVALYVYADGSYWILRTHGTTSD